MNTKQFGVIAIAAMSMSAMAVPKHLVYYSTFDDVASITSPVVGEAGTKAAGKFVSGYVGSALQVPAFTQAVRVPFSKGLPVGKGRIEFYGRIDSGRTTFYDLDDPNFFGFHQKGAQEQAGESGISLFYTCNNGGGRAGLCTRFCGVQPMSSHEFCSSYSSIMGSGDPAAWHHYEIVWNTNGIASISGRPAVAVLLDGKLITSRAVSELSIKGHINGMQSINSLTFTVDTTRGRSAYSVDEFKIWDTDVEVVPGEVPETPILNPASGAIFETSLTVSMSCATEDATIRYTLDGSTPTVDSEVYTGKFRIYGKTTVKAIAFFEDGTPSEMAVAEYIKGTCEAPTLSTQTEFTGSQQKVELACATVGASIHYTVDGTTPTTQSAKYERPFYVTANTVVKAYAVKPDYTDSGVATFTIAKIWGIGDTLGKPDHTFATGGDNGFVRVVDASSTLGESMKSGAIGNNQTSELSTTVVGAGTLSFQWRTSCEEDPPLHEWDHAELSVDGDVVAMLDGTTDWIKVGQRIEGEGEHIVIWTYVKDGEESEGQDCMWVSDYAWASDYTTTQTTDVPVPYAWLREKSRDIVDEYDNYEKVAKQTAANPRFTVEECYVADLDPESTTNEFTAAVAMDGGIPVITWKPDLKAKRDYKIWGKEALEDTAPWQYPTNALHRFFKVTVEMP